MARKAKPFHLEPIDHGRQIEFQIANKSKPLFFLRPQLFDKTVLAKLFRKSPGSLGLWGSARSSSAETAKTKPFGKTVCNVTLRPTWRLPEAEESGRT